VFELASGAGDQRGPDGESDIRVAARCLRGVSSSSIT
jgi:hypothetical protein